MVKLGGFDYAIYIKDNTSESVGSIFYAAPEIIKNLEYDEKCDLWSLGITLYELLFGKLPYGKNVSISVIKQSIYYEDNFYYDKTNNSVINILFKKLLTLNRKNRINYKEFFDYLSQHLNTFIPKDEIKNEYGIITTVIVDLHHFKPQEEYSLFLLVKENKSNYFFE